MLPACSAAIASLPCMNTKIQFSHQEARLQFTVQFTGGLAGGLHMMPYRLVLKWWQLTHEVGYITTSHWSVQTVSIGAPMSSYVRHVENSVG